VARYITKPAISVAMESLWSPRVYEWYGQQSGLQSFHVAPPPQVIVTNYTEDADIRVQDNTATIRGERTTNPVARTVRT
jgi:hypothetical protein